MEIRAEEEHGEVWDEEQSEGRPREGIKAGLKKKLKNKKKSQLYMYLESQHWRPG